MKKNLYIFIALISVAVALWIIFSRSSGTISDDLKAFAVDDTMKITKLFLADKNNNSVLLVKNSPGNWTVNNKFRARNDLVDILLSTINSVNVIAPVAKAAQDQVIKDIASKGVKIEIYRKKYFIDWFGKIRLFEYESLDKVYYVGGPTQDHNGTYMILEGKDTPFITYIQGFTGFLSPRYSPRERDWRNRTIFSFRVDEIKRIIVQHPDSAIQDFSLEYLGNRDFRLKHLNSGQILQNPDTIKVLDYFTNFHQVSYEDFPTNLTQLQVDSIKKHKPLFQIILEDKFDKQHIVKAWKKLNPYYNKLSTNEQEIWDKDRMYASINNDSDFVLIQYFTFDNLSRTFDFFKRQQVAF